MQNTKYNLSDKSFFIGISLTSNSNYDSGICTLDNNRKIISLDKFYVLDDLGLFLKNFMPKKNTIFMVSIPPDITLLDGKWRITAKNYKMLSDNFEINRNNWTNRNSSRANDILLQIKESGYDIFRYDISNLRLKYGINQTYVEHSSHDCKAFHNALKIKYKFTELPENILPISNMEAVLGAMFAYDIYHKNIDYKKVCEFNTFDVLN